MNLSAPIVPGTSAAGISIGDEILPIIREHKPDRIQQAMTGDIFHFDNLKLWSTPDRITVNQIAVFGVYAGATKEGLAINLPISEVVSRIGEIHIGEYDELCIDGYPGIGLETTGEGDSEVVSHIVVYRPNSEQGGGGQAAARSESA